MRKSDWTDKALLDLDNILRYWAIRRGNKELARSIYGAICEVVSTLRRANVGRPGIKPGTYEKIIQKYPYLVVYEYADNRVVVLRIFHGVQDWQTEMLEDQNSVQ
ncbi:MAG: type II toxin-antitoxin system RelE/ParE family toxin [Candidatus Adiutrix sp.]|jgi:plasmid stabilization system protein ParE|nr:type II toxin-antitoxin system RelE/ParE family toxin [Candidatus Adiutrix sp.]